MAHSHSHDTDVSVPSSVKKAVVFTLIPMIALVILGLILLWPSGDGPTLETPDFVRGTVTAVETCPETNDPDCLLITVVVDEGPDEGVTSTVRVNAGAAVPDFTVGTEVYLTPIPEALPGENQYALVDIDRTKPILLLTVITALAVVLLAGWKGVSAIVGLVASLMLLGVFVLPALVEGAPPVAVAAVGAGAIAIVSMGFAHGLRVLTGVALIGTLIALLLTTLLGWVFTELMNFTGVASDDAAYLGAVADEIDLEGLLLAGLVIGAMGVLDDVTVTQASTVWEVHGADQRLDLWQLVAAGMRVGKDHVAAVVNTLVLAYVGASLPLFLLITMSDAPIWQSLSNEAIATEIVRSLVGALGIIAAVPITTSLAAVVLVGLRRKRSGSYSPYGGDNQGEHV